MTYDPVGAICRAIFGEPRTIRQTTDDVTPSVPKAERQVKPEVRQDLERLRAKAARKVRS